jgi:putative transposase
MINLVSYKRHRFPSQTIAHAVWLYFRFPLSLRLVEEMLLERGIVVSYETPDSTQRGLLRSPQVTVTSPV